MTETLQEFASACKAALSADSGRAGLDKICSLVEVALNNKAFMAENITTAEKQRNVVYEDSELGFCVCIHSYAGAAEGVPHDHGPTWAIYGQAEGETEMTDWEIIEEASNGTPATVRKTRTYTMKPGDAHVYETGDVHAPLRYAPTRLLRIEGMNTDKITRTPLVATE